MIRYSIIAVMLLLTSFLVQQFLPAFTGMYYSRILLVQLIFLCVAVTVGSPAMLLMAFIGGFLWDCHCALGPHGGDPEVYNHPAESLRFGYSILLFAAMGYLMQGIQPLFQQGKWQFSAMLSGIAVFFYLTAEYMLINFVRGDWILSRGTVNQMIFTSILTMLFSPVIFWILFQLAKTCDYSIYPEARKKRRSQY